MNDPAVRAFFIGRALANLLRERLEHSLTDLVSQMGKNLAEFQELCRTFPDDVMTRAQQEESNLVSDPLAAPLGGDDLQATLDDLRAEVAQLRSELQKYRSQSS